MEISLKRSNDCFPFFSVSAFFCRAQFRSRKGHGGTSSTSFFYLAQEWHSERSSIFEDLLMQLLEPLYAQMIREKSQILILIVYYYWRICVSGRSINWNIAPKNGILGPKDPSRAREKISPNPNQVLIRDFAEMKNSHWDLTEIRTSFSVKAGGVFLSKSYENLIRIRWDLSENDFHWDLIELHSGSDQNWIVDEYRSNRSLRAMWLTQEISWNRTI